MVKIEKGIPIPPRVCGRRSTRYPWTEMRVGDSFMIRNKKPATVHAQVNQARKTYDAQYTVRAVAGGFRVWRVKA